MKSNGDPNRYLVMIPRHSHISVEVVAKSVEEAREVAARQYIEHGYARAPVTYDGTEPKERWMISLIEGCC